MWQFIDEFDVVSSIIDLMELYCDNTRAIANAKNHGSNKQTMHIKHKCHVIREFVENEDIKMCKVGTESNTADSLTKSLLLAKYERYVGAMSVRYMTD
jgi:hypothetical protein